MMVKTRINGEFDIILPKHRADREEWYRPEGWEKKRLQHMHEHLSDKDILYYVGAEEGDMPALCAMWGAKLVLFEPNERVWANIKAIFEANNLESPWCFNGFASDKHTPQFTPANLTIGFPDCADGEIISDHGFRELHDPGDIPQTTLDHVTEILADGGEIPTAISLDVEGSEWHVLRGAEKTLREKSPKIWLSLHPEFMYEHFKTYAFDLRRWLKDLGYTETLLDYQHEVHLYYEKTK